MARRATWRIPIRMEVKLKFGARVCSGTVTNLSERGMYVSTDEKDLTENALCDISVPLKDEVLHVPGKLVRLAKINGSYDGVGIELLNPSQNYLDYVESLLFVL